MNESVAPAGTPGRTFSVQKMALYNLERARATVQALQHKARWELADTANFDCMHYEGQQALDHAAAQLRLTPGAHVLDIGAGFSATGRYLHQRYGVTVTGVELQDDMHAMAAMIIERSGMSPAVRSVHGDFLALAPTSYLPQPVDHIISLLCILHVEDRAGLLARAAAALRRGGTLYIEDFYARAPLNAAERRSLADVVRAAPLPTRQQYLDDVTTAGFVEIAFEDVSPRWTQVVQARARAYRQAAGRSLDLEVFYDTVANLFAGGRLGGVRLTASRPA